MSGGGATGDKEGWHCVSKIEYLSLIAERKTSPLGRDSMCSPWKVNQRPGVPNPGESENVETISATTRGRDIGSLEAARGPSAVSWRGGGQTARKRGAGGWGAGRCGRRVDLHHLHHSLPGSPGQQPGPEAPGRPAPQWGCGRRNPAFDDAEAVGPPGAPSLAVPPSPPSTAAPLPATPSFPSGTSEGWSGRREVGTRTCSPQPRAQASLSPWPLST